jgi:hypothetical protein
MVALRLRLESSSFKFTLLTLPSIRFSFCSFVGTAIMNTPVNKVYVIFTQAFFVPSVLAKSPSYKEPFESFVNTFAEEVKAHRQDLTQFLSRGDTPFWDKHLFIPNIGRVSFNLRKNVSGRLLLGYCGLVEDEWFEEGWENDSKHTFTSSKHFLSTLHLPFLVEYKKKVNFIPSFNQFVKIREAQAKFGHYAPKSISQNNRVYLHFYPYGLL